MSRKQLERMLEVLKHIRNRPGMYIGNSDGILPFQSGLYLALRLIDFIPPEFDTIHNQVVTSRGWTEQNSLGVWGQMLSRGYDKDAIVAELIDIDIAVFEQLLHQPSESESE